MCLLLCLLKSFLFFFVLLICSDFSWVTSIVVSVTANNSCISICWNDSQGSFWCDTWMEWVLKNSLGKSFQPYTFSGLLTDFQILIILAPSLQCNSFLLIVKLCQSGSLFYFSWIKDMLMLVLSCHLMFWFICIIHCSVQAFLIFGLVVSGKLK